MEKVSPTRMNLLILKDRVQTSQNGLDLLRSKREALVREFLKIMDQTISSRDLFHDALQVATNALTVALGIDGRAIVESATFATRRDLSVELTEKNVWGVRFPDLQYRSVVRSSDARSYALSSVSSHTNTAAREFEKTLDAALKIVSVEIRLKKIGTEIRKTTRRINALTEVILPVLKSQIRSIRFVLEEREREATFRMKRFKEIKV
jgi:V/A-type H+/Na+-transporting ATPase subunit D